MIEFVSLNKELYGTDVLSLQEKDYLYRNSILPGDSKITDGENM